MKTLSEDLSMVLEQICIAVFCNVYSTNNKQIRDEASSMLREVEIYYKYFYISPML